MEEDENMSTKCHKTRTYTENFKKSITEDYEVRKGEYAREKGIPDDNINAELISLANVKLTNKQL